MIILIIVVNVGSALWLALDAKKNHIIKGFGSGLQWVPNCGPLGWFFLTCICWIYFFPVYLVFRKRLMEANSQADLRGERTGKITSSTETPQKNRSVFNKIMWACIVILALLFVGSHCGKESSGVKQSNLAPNEQKAKTISAGQLYHDYQANEVSADNKYKEKTLEVTGRVESITKDVFDNPSVTLMAGGEYSANGVDLHFNKKHLDWLSGLRKGQLVTVTGTCRGMILGSPQIDVE